jgi:hypothetical protein
MRHPKFSLTFSVMALALLLALEAIAAPSIIGQQWSVTNGQANERRADKGWGTEQRADPCKELEHVSGEARGLHRRCLAGASGGVSKGDFNGDGFADLAIGMPRENVGDIADAGAVSIIYGSATGLSATAGPGNQFFTQGSLFSQEDEADDNFGAALAAGDFNNDGKSDLAIGAPREVSFGARASGVVYVMYGSSNGLTASGAQFFIQGLNGLPDAAEDGDMFGEALNWGDFNGDKFGDLAIGIPNEDLVNANGANRGFAGAVQIIYGSAAGLSATAGPGNQFWHQDSPGIAGSVGSGDFFGKALAAGDFDGDKVDDLAIGVPGEGLESGTVQVLYGSFSAGLTDTSDELWHQNVDGILDIAEADDEFGNALAAGDFNGDGRDDLVVGVSGEDLGETTGSVLEDAGAVNVIYGSSDGLTATGNQFWTQNSPDILDRSEAMDFFGAALAVGDFSGDGRADLAIGMLAESVSNVFVAGGVNVIYGTSNGLRATITVSGETFVTNQFWTENNANFSGAAEEGDQFGAALTAWDFNNDGKADLAIGIPREDVGSIQDAGAVLVLYGRQSTVGNFTFGALTTSGRQVWTQDSPGIEDQAESDDRFGTAVY